MKPYIRSFKFFTKNFEWYIYIWYIKNVFFLCNKKIKNLSNNVLFVHCRSRNPKYLTLINKKIKIYTNAILLRKINILNKHKWKSPQYFYFSLKLLATLLIKANYFLSQLFIKGYNSLSFLTTSRYWNELPLLRDFFFIINYNHNYNLLITKKKQSIKKRLHKRFLKIEQYKL